MRILLATPGSSRPSVIAETHTTITDQTEQRLRELMYDRNCANGILFDPTTCVVLRDTYDDMGPEAIQVEFRLQTDEVLSLVRGSTLDDRVTTWLALLSSSWNHALPTSEAVAPLLYDFVPAAVGTEIHVVGGAP